MLPVTKIINLAQLQAEMVAAGVDVGQGLGMDDQNIFPHYGGSDWTTVGGPGAEAGEFADPAAAQRCIDAHVAMRDKTDAEYASEFQDASTTPARRQEIRDQMSGLLPREQVPMT